MEQHKVERSESRLTPADRPWRIAFPFLHTKRTKRPNGQPLDKPRNDATVLAPKLHNDPAQCPNYQFLTALCMEAATKSWGQFPQGGHWPIKDGDAPPKPKAPVPGQAAQPIDPNKYAWQRGHWVIEVGHNLDAGPTVSILQNGQAVAIAAQTIAGRQMYKSGDYAVVSLQAYTFNKNGKFGCNFGFDGVMFVGAGEQIGASSGPKSAEQMFGAVVGQVPAMPGQGQTQQMPTTPPLPTSGPGAFNPHAAPSVPVHPAAMAPQQTAVAPFPSSVPPAPPAAALPPFPGQR